MYMLNQVTIFLMKTTVYKKIDGGIMRSPIDLWTVWAVAVLAL